MALPETEEGFEIWPQLSDSKHVVCEWKLSTVLTDAPETPTTSSTPGCANMSSKSGRSGTGPLFVSTVSLNVELLIAGTSRPTHASGSAKLTRLVRGSPLSVVYVATAETVVDIGMHFVCT